VFSVATWNVNSIRSRLAHLLVWLREDKPDIVLLQELKCTEDAFPAMEIEELGYNIAMYGEKSYNGVAILSKFPLNDICKGLSGDESDTHARYIEALANVPGGVVRVASVYVPNGQEAASDKFSYKLRFLDRLYYHVKKLLEYQEILIIGGDYNIAPEDVDVHDPKSWEGSVLTHDKVRYAFRKIINMGVYDACRLKQSGADTQYSWWDYRANAFAANNGLRIDHLLLSPQAADRLMEYHVNINPRGMEKASDHTPVIGRFQL
jgi:exodeoxyribonuclease-3